MFIYDVTFDKSMLCLFFLILSLIIYIRNKIQYFLDPNYKKHKSILLLKFSFYPKLIMRFISDIHSSLHENQCTY